MARVYLGLGSNVGDRHLHLESARRAIGDIASTRWVRISPIYETDPVGGPAGQGRFLNAVAEIETGLEPNGLLEQLLRIERDAGREPFDRRLRNGPRPLDIDILLFDDRLVDQPRLIIPHPRMQDRWFVLQPLSDLGPGIVHPGLGRTIGQLLEQVDGPESVPAGGQ